VTASQQSDEWRRLSSAASLSDIVARSVTGFASLPVRDALPCDSGTFAVPAGWHLASPGDTPEQPVRVAVTGHRSRGGWQGCDTLAAFGFTGIPPVDIFVDHAACTLRDLNASGVTTRSLDTPVMSGVCAVRSAGYFTAARSRMWAQFSTYVAGSEHPRSGRLIQHSLFIRTQRRTQLRTDIAYLSDAVHRSFRALLNVLS
jgi:hypothetical protein